MRLCEASLQKHNVQWIDCIRAAMILLVVAVHMYGPVYQNANLVNAVFNPSVPGLIMITGYVSYLGGEKYRKIPWYKVFWMKSRTMLGAYCIASVIYTTVHERFFDLASNIHNLVYFGADTSFYYVAVYLQLMLVFLPMYMVMQRIPNSAKGVLVELLMGAGIVLISVFTSNYTDILGIHGAGGKLLGGSLLIMFYVGMLLGKHRCFLDMGFKKSIWVVCVFGICMVLCMIWIYVHGFSLDRFLPFGDGEGQPVFSQLVVAFSMFCFLAGVFELLGSVRFAEKVLFRIAILGTHTLYIYLYHRFIMHHFLNHIVMYIPNAFLKWVLYYVVAVGGALLIETLFHFIRKKWKCTSSERKVTV